MALSLELRTLRRTVLSYRPARLELSDDGHLRIVQYADGHEEEVLSSPLRDLRRVSVHTIRDNLATFVGHDGREVKVHLQGAFFSRLPGESSGAYSQRVDGQRVPTARWFHRIAREAGVPLRNWGVARGLIGAGLLIAAIIVLALRLELFSR